MVDRAKVGKRSNLKGKTFERDIARRLTALTGKTWRRTICSGGQYESDDIKCLEPGWPSIECKNRQDITLTKVYRNPAILRGIVSESVILIFNSEGFRICIVPTSIAPSCNIDAPVANFELDGVAYWLFSLDYFAEVIHGK